MSDTLESLEDGEFLRDLALEVAEVASQARATGKAGSVAITIKVTPKGSTQVEIDCAITAKPPKYDRRTTPLFVDGDGHLSRRDPRQPAFANLRDLD